MTTNNTTTQARNDRSRAALSALSAAMGVRRVESPEARVAALVAQLETGTRTRRNGKQSKLSLTATARIIVKLVKCNAGGMVPAVARTRFPWGAVSRELLTEVAESHGANPAAFLAALGIACTDETATATEPTATEPTATEPTAAEPTATEPTTTEPTATEPAATPGTNVVQLPERQGRRAARGRGR